MLAAVVFGLMIVVLALALAPSDTPDAPEASMVPTAAPSAAPSYEAEAKRILKGMTTREKICQLLIVQPESLPEATDTVRTLTPALRADLEDYPVGGVLLTVTNMASPAQLKTLTADLRDAVPIPMILCVDEEGGEIARLMHRVGTTKLDNMFTYRSKGPGVARLNARTLGKDLSSFGFNTDLAPVADVWSNPETPVIGERAYSDDFGTAATLVAAAVQGFHDSGTICCLKHFPGHGCTRTDSHEEAAFVDETPDALREREFLPFASGIDAGADMVMVGHLTVPALDSVPATYSKTIVTELLRGELGFDGVVITDGMEMKAAGNQPDGQKALRALTAGCDLLLGLQDIPETVQTLEQALRSGALSQEELDAHVLRVLMLKLQYGLTPVQN